MSCFINVRNSTKYDNLIKIFRKKTKFVCLNDVFTDKHIPTIQKVLNEIYPKKSQFEK